MAGLDPQVKRLQDLGRHGAGAAARLEELRQQQQAARQSRQAEYQAAGQALEDWHKRGWYAKGGDGGRIWERWDAQGSQLPAPTLEEVQAHEQAGREAQRRYLAAKAAHEKGLPEDEELMRRMATVEEAGADLKFRMERLRQGLPEMGLKQAQAQAEKQKATMDDAPAGTPAARYPTSAAEFGIPPEKSQRAPIPAPDAAKAQEREAEAARQALDPIFLRMFRGPEEIEAIFKSGLRDRDAAQALAWDDERRKANGGQKPEPVYQIDPISQPAPAPAPADAATTLAHHREMLGNLKGAGFNTAKAQARGFILPEALPPAPGVNPKTIANQLLHEWTTGTPVNDQQLWPTQRTDFARKLGWQGKPGEVISDEALYDLAGTRLKAWEADRVKREQVYHHGQLAALRGRSQEDTRRDLKALTGGREAEFEKALKAGRDSITGMLGEGEPLRAIQPLYEVLTRDAQRPNFHSFFEPDAQAAFKAYAEQKHQGRQKMFTALDLLAREDQYSVGDLYERLGDAMKQSQDRVIDRLNAHSLRAEAKGIATALKYGRVRANIGWDEIPAVSDYLRLTGLRWAPMGNEMDGIYGTDPRWLFQSNKYRPLLPQERKQMEERQLVFQGMADFLTDAAAYGPRIKQDVDTPEHTGLLDWAGDTLVALGGSSTELALAAMPNGRGLYALGIAGYEDHLARLRQQYADAPEAQLAPRAALGAALETGISRLEFLTTGARLPGVQAALAKYGKYGRFGAGVLDKAGAIAGGTLLEPFENSSLEISSGIFSAIKRDLPGPDWDKVVARETAALGDYASVTTALTVTMGLGRRAVEVFDRRRLREQLSNPRELELTGVGKEAAEKIALTAEQDPAAAADMLKEVVETTPVEQRREQAWVVQEQVLQEQQQQYHQLQQQRQMQPQQQRGGEEDAGEAPAPSFEAELVERALREAEERGNVASTDKVRPLLTGYETADPMTRETNFHQQAGALNGEVIRRLLAREPKTRLALLLAGGPGSGKTSVLDDFDITRDLAVDTMLSREKRAWALIDQIREASREPVVLYVHRGFKDAFEGNILRYLEGKETGEHRLVPLRASAEAHIGSQETTIALADKGIAVVVIDNSGAPGSATRKDLGFLHEHRYTRNHGRNEAGPEASPAHPAGNPGNEGTGGARSAEGSPESTSQDREQATKRLTEEGRAVLDRYLKEGKLTPAEVNAFLKVEGAP